MGYPLSDSLKIAPTCNFGGFWHGVDHSGEASYQLGKGPMTRLDEPATVKKMTDELCGMAVVLVTARVAAQDRIARFGSPSHDTATPLRPHPIFVIRDDGQQTAMLTGGTGFDLVHNVMGHWGHITAAVHRRWSITGRSLKPFPCSASSDVVHIRSSLSIVVRIRERQQRRRDTAGRERTHTLPQRT
jgi:hypothetical protein